MSGGYTVNHVHSLSLDLQSISRALTAGMSPRDILGIVYDRIERRDRPHVFTTLLSRRRAFEQMEALEASARFGVELPLLGVTFAVKDNIDVLGMPTTAACPAYAYMPARSAPAVQRLVDAGAVCVGKTNMDQFATGLVGTRSPYGECENVFKPEYISGGSSSGSAVAVAAGWVSFSLGTDTAGSGRVPAALNNIVGVKPSPGLISTAGVVPACRSLDCVSIFSLTCDDGARLREILRDTEVPAGTLDWRSGFRFGTPPLESMTWFGDELAQAQFLTSVERMRGLGGTHVEIDWSPFAEAGELLYNGPWVAERAAGFGDFVQAHREQCLPVVVDILATADRVSGADVFVGMRRLDELRALAAMQWRGMDTLLLPTAPTVMRRGDVELSPRECNDRLGVYTRFANLLRCCVLAVPAGLRPDGLPFGVSLVAAEGQDLWLDDLAAEFHTETNLCMGATGHVLPTRSPSSLPGNELVPIAVVGAHLSGMPLNHQLVDAGATLVRNAKTAACYRLYALPSTRPAKPGLVRVSSDGAAIEVEVWAMPRAAVGAFLQQVPPPLAIGTLELLDGERVKGFLCEAHAVVGARDITEYGGFRAFVHGQVAHAEDPVA